MKKIFIILVAILATISCKPKVDFNKLMDTDYAAAVSEYPDSVVRFYEVETVLDKPINCIDEKLNVSASSTIIQVGSKVKQIDRTFKNNRIQEENVTYNNGWWVGDLPIPLDSVKLNFNDAVQRLRETNTVLPETSFMTFRKPASPPFETYYIFGSEKTFYLFVNAITGEVTSGTE